MVADDAARALVDRTFRDESGRAVATLIRVTGDFDLAEEAVQDAFIVALETWAERGIPDNPGAWITTTARNRAVDRLRRRRRLLEKTDELRRRAAIEAELAAEEPSAGDAMAPIADDRLRLIEALAQHERSPVVELNRAVAVAMAEGPEAGLALVEQIASGGSLAGYPYLHATRADLLRRLGRPSEAVPRTGERWT